MTVSIPTLTWTDTTDAAAPVADYAVNFGTDPIWEFVPSGSYHGTEAQAAAVTVDNTANANTVQMQNGQNFLTIPGYQRQSYQLVAASQVVIFTCINPQTISVQFYTGASLAGLLQNGGVGPGSASPGAPGAAGAAGAPGAPGLPGAPGSSAPDTTVYYPTPGGGGSGGSDVIPGYMQGFTLSNDAVTPNTVLDISQGVCADSVNLIMISVGNFTKSIAGAWAAGSGKGGLGVGVVAGVDTWLHVFAIINAGVPDIYFDSSPTAANPPAGTTSWRLLESIYLGGAAHIQPFLHLGNTMLWTTVYADFAGTLTAGAGGTTAINPLTTPAGRIVQALIRVSTQLPGGDSYIVINPTGVPASTGPWSLGDNATGSLVNGEFELPTIPAQTINIYQSFNNVQVGVVTRGWRTLNPRFLP